MAILILLGILAVGTVSILPDSNATLAAESIRLRSHLRYTQIRAQSDIHQWRLVFTNATTYEIGPIVLPGAGFTPAIVPGTGTTHGTLTAGVTTPAGTVIRFDSWGRPRNESGTLLISDQTITLTQGGHTRNITIRMTTGLIP